MGQNFYNDSKYGMVERVYLGPHQNTKSIAGGDPTLLKRFYPKGPITITKFGVQHVATQGGTEIQANLKRNSSTLATVIASTDSAPWTIASKSVDKDCDAGSYLSVDAEGTVATGSVIAFIDFVRKYDHDGKWDE